MTPNEWHRSSYCSTGACTLVRRTGDGTVQVRDSKADDGPILTFDPRRWRAFIDAVKGGGL